MERFQGEDGGIYLKIAQFISLARVPTLAGTVVPIMVGGALGLSVKKFDLFDWLDILVVALLMQIATNALNEYGDYRHGIDTDTGPGFSGIIVTKKVSAKVVLLIAATCYAIAFSLGIALVFVRGVVMLLLGATAFLAGVLYSEGPLPVSSTPLGETLVGLVMGPIEVISACLAASGEIPYLSFVFSIPVGLMVAAILLTNNLRDIDKDRNHGRQTLATLIGRKRGSVTLFMMIVMTFLWSFPAFFLFSASASVFLLWLAFPVALQSYRILKSNLRWDKSVAMISKLNLLIGTLLALSILLHF
jgi:1,4-dihydroxy-2-naphthoate octaprenyltransferase